MEEKQKNIEQIHQLIEDIQTQLAQLKQLVASSELVDEQRTAREKAQAVGSQETHRRGTIVEGVFDGQNMVGPDGKVYTVPPNYASKSKLVSGDILKLTIGEDGSFLYKQIGPVKRQRQLATLVRDQQAGTYHALTKSGRSYRLLSASVTYYRGEPGDTLVLLLPEGMETRWAAVENIMKEEPTEAESAQLLDSGDHGELTSAHGALGLGDEIELSLPEQQRPEEEKND